MIQPQTLIGARYNFDNCLQIAMLNIYFEIPLIKLQGTGLKQLILQSETYSNPPNAILITYHKLTWSS